jgi:hypothetical protein
MNNAIQNDHPLIGTWITCDEDSDAAFVISVVEGQFSVSGFARCDAEAFQISDLVWDGNALHFSSLMPSTGFKSKHVFRAQPDGSAEVEFTWWEPWKKKDVKPGDIPEAWQTAE